jgi:hypothetical protein
MNNNLEFENEDPSPDSIEDNHPRTNYGEGYGGKETLEEAKLRQLFKNRSNCYADADDVIQAMDENCFIETIKEWQQERMYTEEDMKQFAEWLIKVNFNYTSNTTDVFLIWKKQFKKK